MLELDLLAERAGQQAVQLGHDLVEVQDPLPHDFAAAEDQQLAGERRRALRGAADLLDVRGRRRVLADVVGHELGVVEDDPEEVVEVVGDAAGELSHALQAP